MSSRTVEFSPSAVSTGSFFDHLARQTLERIIGKLDRDRITLRDDTGERTFGTRSAEGFHATVDVRRRRFYRRILTGGSLGAAEAFLDGDWTTDDLTVLIRILICNMHVADSMDRGLSRIARLVSRGVHWLQRNTRAGSRRNIEAHYDLGNDFFRLFLDTYFRKCGELLKPDGLMLVQGIVMNEQRYLEYLRSADFIQRYVFPGGCLPSVLAMGQSVAKTTDMRVLHLADFASHYARTLSAWRTRFHSALDRVRELGYSERFIRLWEYYLCYCEAAFSERYVGVVQMLLAKPASRRDLYAGSAPAARSALSACDLAGGTA